MDYSEVTVVIPTLNEAGNVSKLVSELSTRFSAAQIIVVDDGSKDGTLDEVRSLNAHTVSVIDRAAEPIHGLTASVLTAIESCHTRFFVVMDADLQHPPETIEAIHSKLVSGFPIVVAQRSTLEEAMPAWRTFISNFGIALARVVLSARGIQLSDPTSGFFGCRTSVAREIIGRSRHRFALSGYKVLFDLLKSSRGMDLKVGEVPFRFNKRLCGESKFSLEHCLVFLRSLLH